MSKGKIIFLALLCILLSIALPFGLKRGERQTVTPQIQGFRHSHGDILNGQIVYHSRKDISGFETELQLSYGDDGIIDSALLIFGPSGIDSGNCMAKYKSVLSILKKKYGKHGYVKETKDAMADDLVSDSMCGSIRVGLREMKTVWNLKGMIIDAKLIGDEYGFYIEVDYILRNTKKASDLIKVL